MGQDGEAFQEFGDFIAYADDSRVVCLFVAHHHFHLDVVFRQGFHEASGCYGAAAGAFACAYEEHFHRYASFPIHLLMRFCMALRMCRKLP